MESNSTRNSMTGGEAAVQTAKAAGIDVCFANAGTTEIHLVNALDRTPGMRAILGLFEGVCSGAADGYGRIAGRPALGLYHLGPGFANSAANQHNSRRAFTPVVNLIGDQASWHLDHDAPLTSDIDAIAGWAGWVGRSTSADDTSSIMAAAIAAATDRPGGPASVVLAADHTWTQTSAPLATAMLNRPNPPDPDAIAEAARAIASAERPVLIVAGHHISADAKRAIARIGDRTGCRTFIGRHARTESGAGRPAIDALPYFPEPLIAALAGADTAVLAGAPEPVCFFGYPGQPSQALPPDATRATLCTTAHDLEAALIALAEELDATTDPVAPGVGRAEAPTGELTGASLAQAIASWMPENAIVVQEAITNRAALERLAPAIPSFTQLNLNGGAIGEGLPLGVGAAVAAPDRPVINFQADGSGLYTIQSLWTMAREELDITVVIINNRKYQIIEVEAMRAELEPGSATRQLLDLDRPEIDFAKLADGFGVPSARATTADEVVRLLDGSQREAGPFLIDAVL